MTGEILRFAPAPLRPALLAQNDSPGVVAGTVLPGTLPGEEVHGTVSAHGEAFRQRLAGLGWSHRQDGQLGAVRLFEAHGLGDGPAIEGIDGAGDARSNDGLGLGVEAQLGDFGSLFDRDEHAHVSHPCRQPARRAMCRRENEHKSIIAVARSKALGRCAGRLRFALSFCWDKW